MVEKAFFDEVGGHTTFTQIVDAFYARVPEDDILGPMYPADDFEGAKWRLQAFLEQYFGGPTAYGEQRGHPRLRMRHHPFAVTPAARDRWLEFMEDAVGTIDSDTLDDEHREQFLGYVRHAAEFMINTPDH